MPKPGRREAKQARGAYKAAQRAEQAGDWKAAWENYGRAASLWPGNAEFIARREAARFRLVQQHVDRAEREALVGRVDVGRSELRAALALDPGYSVAQERLAQLASSTPQSSPPAASAEAVGVRLRTLPGKRSFNYRGGTRGAFEEVAAQFGVKAIADEDLRDRQIRFRIVDVDFETALRLLDEQTGSFWRAIDEHNFVVAENTPPKRRQYAESIERTVTLPGSDTPDQMTETLRLVREIAGIARTQLDSRTRTLTMRDSPEAVELAVELVRELEQSRGEMMLEIEILEVDRTQARKLGITPPATAQVFTLSPQDITEAQQSAAGLLRVVQRLFGTPSTVNQMSQTALIPPLIAFGGGKTIFLATLPGAAADFGQTLSLVRTGRRMLLRAQNGRPATFFVGDRFPINLAVLSPSFVGQPLAPAILPGTLIRSDFATGNGPAAVLAGDFNADGKLDLAVADEGSNTVSILLGNGDGTFGNKTDFPVGTSPVALAAGDFNADGKLDLAVANQGSNTVSILLGNGDGTFAPKTDIPTGQNPASLITTDLNSDGRFDLAVVNQGSNSVSVLLGNGDGTFGPRADFATGDSPVSVAAGDFNADGRLDLAVANRTSGTVSILLGRGDGTFGSKTDFVTGVGPAAVTTGDFNADRRLDLAVANQNSNSVSILLGVGDGTFRPKTDFPTGEGPKAIITGDSNGDGKPDLVTANQTANSVSVLLGNGDGSFGPKTDLTTGSRPFALATGLFNADRALDLVVANMGSNNVSLFLNPTTQAAVGLAATAPYPGFQYEDLGLKVRATPRLHFENEVTLQLQFEIRSLSGAAFNGIPILSNRTLEQTVRVRENETTLLTGILQREEALAITGLPGFSSAAGVGHLAGRRNKDNRETELLIFITPRRIRLAPRLDRTIYAGRDPLTTGPAGPPRPPQ